MALKFGTDGVRGLAFKELKPEWVAKLAAATVRATGVNRFVIGEDGRETGAVFSQALINGFTEEGASCEYLKVIPTPAIAHIATLGDFGGAVVSASHNQAEYNGVKLFLPGGKKLTDKNQDEIEKILGSAKFPDFPAQAMEISRSRDTLVNSWISSLKESISVKNLSGLSIVVDCANGAASEVAPKLFTELGINVVSINDSPNGRNINLKCGSTDMSDLTEAVLDLGVDLGIAFDGDADRVLAIDNEGKLVDGDQIIAISAIDMNSRGVLHDGTVVVSVMTNFGFHLAMQDAGIKTHITPVGDRSILQALRANNWSLGGEQSGHIVYSEMSSTGDGILTALQLFDIVQRTNSDLHSLAQSSMRKYPQALKSVELPKEDTDIEEKLKPAIEKVENLLQGEGRVLVRPSGTEPILRIMVEASTHEEVERLSQELATTAKQILT